MDSIKEKISWVIRELLAITFWGYAIIKLLFFDLDQFLIHKINPNLQWIIDYKFFIIVGTLSVLWLLVGKKRFYLFLLFCFGYPFIILFWRLPKLMCRHLPLVFVFLPVIVDVVKSFRTFFVLISFLLISSLFIFISNDIFVISSSMVYLFVLFVVYIWQKLKKAYCSTPFGGLVSITQKFRSNMGDGTAFHVNEDDFGTPDIAVNTRPNQALTTVYLTNGGVSILAEKLQKVGDYRKIDLYLVLSFLFAVVFSILIFTLEYVGLEKLQPGAFGEKVHTFWQFLGFSFSLFTSTDLSIIEPVSYAANLICYIEVGFRFFIIAILVFNILTAARSRYQKDIETLIVELKTTADYIEDHLKMTSKRSIAELELFLAQNDNRVLVDKVRALQGKPVLETPKIIIENDIVPDAPPQNVQSVKNVIASKGQSNRKKRSKRSRKR